MKLSKKYTFGFFILLIIIVYTHIHILALIMAWLIHTLFETIEFMIDELVSHLFNTDRHTTQIITFYVLSLLALLPIYKTYCLFIICYFSFKHTLKNIYQRLHEGVLMYWEGTSVIVKIKWCTLSLLCFSILILLN